MAAHVQWFVKEVRALLSFDAPTPDTAADRFALPHRFEPRLSIGGAGMAVVGAIIRMVLGSILFAVWGIAIWSAWSFFDNWILRIAIILPLIAGFFVTLALLMIGISACERRIHSRFNQ